MSFVSRFRLGGSRREADSAGADRVAASPKQIIDILHGERLLLAIDAVPKVEEGGDEGARRRGFGQGSFDVGCGPFRWTARRAQSVGEVPRSLRELGSCGEGGRGARCWRCVPGSACHASFTEALCSRAGMSFVV